VVRKVIAFDLDGTLAPSKSALPDRMSELLSQLLDIYEVCVMSGGKFGQFEKQLLSNLKASPAQLEKLHLMPTCGTRYYRFTGGKWQKIYSEDLTIEQRHKIIEALKQGAKALGYEEEKIYGDVIEDRGSQVSWSALGQDIVDHLGEEGVQRKEQWDPTNEKKHKLRDYVAKLIPDFEVRTGGSSTIDVTKPGIDKAYGIQKLMDMKKLSKEDIFFIGDRLEEGGNDYPVKAMGIDSIQISNWQETALAIEAVVAVS
jgi:phosphomannomutase